MSGETAPTKEETRWQRFFARLRRTQLLQPLLDSVLPEPRWLKDETVQLTIHMAPYRIRVANLALFVSIVLVVVSGIAALVTAILDLSFAIRFATFLFFLLTLGVLAEALHHILLHFQWQFIVTNKRIIIIAPDPSRQGFADAIYLKGGKIQVVDTNWSRSPWWGLFQASTGARDVVLSMAGYEFKAVGAEVKGGLRFPDVKLEDISKLEELIFG